MNKFGNHYFLMNEAGEGGEGGGSSAPDATQETPIEQHSQDTEQVKTGLESNLFDDTPEDKSDKKPDGEPDQKTDDYDPEKAFSEFEYKLPEGYTLSDEQKQSYIDMAKEKGVKPEQLQTFVDKHIEAEQVKVGEYRTIVEGWNNEVMADPVIGGSNFPETKKNVNNACSISGGAEFREVLSSVGLISNPAVVHYLNNLGKMINTDGIVTGEQVKSNAGEDYKAIYTKSNY